MIIPVGVALVFFCPLRKGSPPAPKVLTLNIGAATTTPSILESVSKFFCQLPAFWPGLLSNQSIYPQESMRSMPPVTNAFLMVEASSSSTVVESNRLAGSFAAQVTPAPCNTPFGWSPPQWPEIVITRNLIVPLRDAFAISRCNSWSVLGFDLTTNAPCCSANLARHHWCPDRWLCR